MIGCSDSRVNPEKVFGSKAGELFVHRNIGNIVAENDSNLGAVLEYAVGELGVRYVIVCGHSGCGAMKALLTGGHGKYISSWLKNATEAKEILDSLDLPEKTGEDRNNKLITLEKENIGVQAKKLFKYDSVKKAVGNGKLSIKGFYYSLEEGTVEEIV
ncbi:carbonic anhydrase [Methanomicrobium sp. W14]|uniref:carbonic anhydrase n=1 Tax=Methanomicrobium sp. W14 TaxID=2817839 RepID=UPI0032AEFFCF